MNTRSSPGHEGLMARLFQRPFFRRSRSQATSTTTADTTATHRRSRANSSVHNDSSSRTNTPSPSPSPKPALAAASNKPGGGRPRKSSSLAKLRERYLAQTSGADIEVPEAVREQRESVLVPELEANDHDDDDNNNNNDHSSNSGSASRRQSATLLTPDSQDVAAGGALSPPRRSGSETLADERRSSSAVSHKTLPDEPSFDSGSCSTATIPVVPAVRELRLEQLDVKDHPTLTLQEPTPDLPDAVDGVAPLGRDGDAAASADNKASNLVTLPKDSHLQYSRRASVEGSPQNQDRSSTRSSRVQSTSTGHSLSPFDTSRPCPKPKRPSDTNIRQQSLVNSANAKVAKSLIDVPSHARPQSIDLPSALPSSATGIDYFSTGFPTDMAHALHRKIWVRRPGASATLVQIREDDLVDDVRDMILRKYANSLGKTFDAPDMTLNIVNRVDHGQQRHERQLGPEEEMCRTIDSYYPGGQTVDDALLINVPTKRTPRPSPRVFQHPSYAVADDYRPLENGSDYFPPMSALVPTTVPQTSGSHDSRTSHHHNPTIATVPEHARSMSVLNTGQVPPLPSPGGTRRHARDPHRPKFNRQHTSSPTIISHPGGAQSVAMNGAPNNLLPQQAHLPHRPSGVRNRLDSTASDHHGEIASLQAGPQPPPLPSPPAPQQAEPTALSMPGSTPQTPPVGGPMATARPARGPRKARKSNGQADDSRSRSRRPETSNSPHPSPSYAALLDGSVPPINVLIVEDNIINLRILEGLMKRLKVRWTTAMNGQIALDKWRAGGFHLVLMDIQMPIMNGLQATKEIRRLERVNGIGVFSSSGDSEAGSPAESNKDGKEVDKSGKEAPDGEKPKDDRLPTGPDTLFKSPVIIVALTASSLQSDRHEALAAGCNDFLTKPVNFVWLERKVKEWGCMQALIDFTGWRKWKDYADEKDAGKSEEEKRKEKEKEARKKEKMAKFAEHQERMRKKNEEEKAAKEKLLEANRRREKEESAARGKAKRNSSSGIVNQMNKVEEGDGDGEGRDGEANGTAAE